MIRHPYALLCNLLLSLSLFLAHPALAEVKQRVISLSPANTELAYAAGLGDNLIAVSAFSDYPAEAAKLEQVADWQGINLERIIALKPDLILAWRGGNPQRPLDQIATLGIPVIYFDPTSIEDIIKAIDILAEYSSQPNIAAQSVERLSQQYAALKGSYQDKNKKQKAVFIQLSTQPLFTVGGDTLQNEVVSLCGGRNIFAESKIPWPQVSREQVLIRKPAVIIVGGEGDEKKTIEQYWQPQLSVPVIQLNADLFHRPGPRILLAAEQLCKQLNDQSDAKNSLIAAQ
nr:vitamin B12 ABC transporter substrate-binding protein BtuF [uncultured Moellerella sp.]